MKVQLFAWILLLASCSGSQKRVSFGESVQARAEVLTEVLISIPVDIKKEGGLLFASDFDGDSLLHVYDLKKRSFVKKMLPQGQGAGEFLSPVEFFFSADSSLFIHNRWHFTAQDYIYRAVDFSIRPQGELIQLPMNLDKIYPIGQSRFVASGVFEDCRFLLLDNRGHVLSRCGDFPNYQDGEEAIPNMAKSMFHQSQFGYHDVRKRLACATSHVFELWDYAPDTLTLHKRLLLAPYHYMSEAGPDGVYAQSDDPDAELGAQGIAVSDNYIYVLYDPNTCRMRDEHTDSRNSEIWVFDWDGKPVRKILTDVRIECFCVDEADAAFYCVMTAPDRCLGVLPLEY